MGVNHLLSGIALSVFPLAHPAAADEPPLGSYATRVQYSGRVVVGEDGNGATSAQFPTSVAGEAVRYALIVENGGAPHAAGNPRLAPPAVASLAVTLNDDVVFDMGGPFGLERVPVALATDGTSNTIMFAARGVPGASARVTLVALQPLPVVVGGRSVLPLAAPSPGVAVSLVVHNAGPTQIAARLELFNTDGSSAGVTPVQTLSGHATLSLDLASVAAQLGTGFTRGAVHVRWAARGQARVSTVAREARLASDGTDVSHVVAMGELALDDYGVFPLGPSEAAGFFNH